ncbi:MAG: prepilin-type N-terminal cleavage/methylation domain-containing protein [Xanthomonadales bacterium]|nr:prepilin-type N-terminal cleavage/methylation domain-containing protein [Xanthomonadales bacterium]
MNPLGTRSLIRFRKHSGGFTLLEVMLAFVIFALSFATVLEILAGSIRSVGRASEDTEVALMAQSLMDLVGTEIPIEEGEYSGTGMDRYQWEMGISLYDTGGQASDEGMTTQELADLSGIELYRVDLYVDWETGRRQRELHFSTIHSILANR